MAIVISTSIGPVGLKEMFDGYEAGLDTSRGPWVRKKYLAPTWASAFPVANALKGIGPRPVPHACPESANLRCLDAVIEPQAEYDARAGGRPEFNLPVIAVTYGVLSWDALATDDPGGNQSFPNDGSAGSPYLFMEQSIDWDTEVIKLPGRAYSFASDGTAIDVPVARSIAVAQFNLTRQWQSILPYANVASYMNRLNATTFLGQPRGQVKFRKCQSSRQFQSDATASQKVAFVFQWREFDHNKQHRPDRYLFELIVDSYGNNPYQYADLSQLLI